MKIACLQTIVPHYREEFFYLIKDKYDIQVYTYKEKAEQDFNISSFPVQEIKTQKFGKILFFDFKQLLKDGCRCVIFPFQAKSILPCLYLIVLSKLYKFKVILWGHGISIPRYIKEETKPNILLKLQLKWADGCWVYMDKEAEQWRRIYPNKPIVALQNTIAGAGDITTRQIADKQMLKVKYGISEERTVIYCARCTAQRRFDILVSAIEKLQNDPIAFIIIGEGEDKPDFSTYKHVYDFGAVYEKEKKDDLFDIADIYFQPGWVGLSIVEAMLYGKPVLTIKRSEKVLQCVEYSYIQNGVNGYILESVDEVCDWLKTKTGEELQNLSETTLLFAKTNLSMKKMVENACSVIDKL